VNCDRAQAALSERMDGESLLSPETAEHLSTCAECCEFHSTTVELSLRYEVQVRQGIDRMRQAEGLPPWGLDAPRRSRGVKARLLIPLAAALLLCWWGMERSKPKTPASPAVSSVALVVVKAPLLSDPALPRLRLFDDLATIDAGEEYLPLRLDQDLLPRRLSGSEVTLPSSLRF
jgi:hypothetical protein